MRYSGFVDATPHGRCDHRQHRVSAGLTIRRPTPNFSNTITKPPNRPTSFPQTYRQSTGQLIQQNRYARIPGRSEANDDANSQRASRTAMGGRQIRPATVWKTKSEEINAAILGGKRAQRPPWLEVLYKCPPSETVVRTVSHGHRAPKKKAAKPRNLYRPQPISYPEDKLRQIFFKDHPWELARPRVLIESDGKDYQFVDWSKGLRQPGVPLTGEW